MRDVPQTRLPTNFEDNSSSTWGDSDVSADSVMLGQANFSGVPFHVIAIRIVAGEHGIQHAEDDSFEAELDRIVDITGGGPLCTVAIPGHSGEYAVAFTPHQN